MRRNATRLGVVLALAILTSKGQARAAEHGAEKAPGQAAEHAGHAADAPPQEAKPAGGENAAAPAADESEPAWQSSFGGLFGGTTSDVGEAVSPTEGAVTPVDGSKSSASPNGSPAKAPLQPTPPQQTPSQTAVPHQDDASHGSPPVAAEGPAVHEGAAKSLRASETSGADAAKQGDERGHADEAGAHASEDIGRQDGDARGVAVQGVADQGAAAHDESKPAASGDGWLSSITGLFGGGEKNPEAPPHAEAGDGAAKHGEVPTPPASAQHGEPVGDAVHGGTPPHNEATSHGEKPPPDAAHAPDANSPHANAQAGKGGGDHGEGTQNSGAHGADAHSETPPAPTSGGWLSSITGLFGGGASKPEDAKHGEEASHADATSHGDAAPDAHGGEAKPAHEPETAHGAGTSGHGDASAHEDSQGDGHGEDHGGGDEHADAADAPPPPLWPDTPAVENDRQPFMLMRKLRAVQDKVAHGSAPAFEEQKRLIRDIGEQMRKLPPQVWDDTRNVRAAVYYVLTGGDPRVLTIVAGHDTPIYVPKRLIKGALAFGEGRTVDAMSFLSRVDARSLDPSLAGIVALIQGTLVAKRDAAKAISLFDEARMHSPGTLIEESALRQEVLLLARLGELQRFDQLSSQYSRRFENSLFARNFRRQFFAGVARQNFKGATEWLSRTEAEMQKIAPGERAVMYLSIAEEATKGGYIAIAKYAAQNASQLFREGSRERYRADLYHGAVLVATDEVEAGLALLAKVDEQKLEPKDQELYVAATSVGKVVLEVPVAPEQSAEAPTASVVKAQNLLSSVDELVNGGTQ